MGMGKCGDTCHEFESVVVADKREHEYDRDGVVEKSATTTFAIALYCRNCGEQKEIKEPTDGWDGCKRKSAPLGPVLEPGAQGIAPTSPPPPPKV